MRLFQFKRNLSSVAVYVYKHVKNDRPQDKYKEIQFHFHFYLRIVLQMKDTKPGVMLLIKLRLIELNMRYGWILQVQQHEQSRNASGTFKTVVQYC